MTVKQGNLFRSLPLPKGEEVFEDLLRTASFRVERIFSTGQSSPGGFWYDQEEDEWVVVLQGEATVEFHDGPTVALEAGGWLFIPARHRHRVASTSKEPPCIWLAVFGPPEGP